MERRRGMRLIEDFTMWQLESIKMGGIKSYTRALTPAKQRAISPDRLRGSPNPAKRSAILTDRLSDVPEFECRPHYRPSGAQFRVTCRAARSEAVAKRRVGVTEFPER